MSCTSEISECGTGLCRLLTSRVSIAPLRRRCPGLQSPPCTSNKQSTRGDTCVLRPPGNTNKLIWTDVLPVRLLSCCSVLCSSETSVLCCVLVFFPPPTVSGDTAATPALLSVCLESAMMSPLLDVFTLTNQSCASSLIYISRFPRSAICHTRLSSGFFPLLLMQDEIICPGSSEQVILLTNTWTWKTLSSGSIIKLK